jgi:D-arginine dehydrogenase
LTPLRRSLALLETPSAGVSASWPLVISEGHGVYFRPCDGQVMFCPMDAEPCPPGDARPLAGVFDEGRKRLASIAPALAAMRVTRAWAGLRTFSNDGVPVVGRDERAPSVFWLAGQAGCGIETSAIVAEVAADLLLEGRSTRFDTALLAPGRF